MSELPIKHVMLDLETLGVNPFAVILSIGAVHFDPWAPSVFRDSFEVAIDLETSVRSGLRMEVDTNLWWWDKKRETARDHWLSLLKFELNLALSGFSEWLAYVSQDDVKDPERPNPNVRIWGNGANFDNVLLACAYKTANTPVPWSFYQDRCFRTLKSLDINGLYHPGSEEEKLMPGLKHTALHDAIYQAQWMQNIVKGLSLVMEQ
jgi:hypothetical protein